MAGDVRYRPDVHPQRRWRADSGCRQRCARPPGRARGGREHHPGGGGRRRRQGDLHAHGEPWRDAERARGQRRDERREPGPALRTGHVRLRRVGGQRRHHGDADRNGHRRERAGDRRHRRRDGHRRHRLHRRDHGPLAGRGRQRDRRDADRGGHQHAGLHGDGDAPLAPRAARRRQGSQRLEPHSGRPDHRRQVPAAVRELNRARWDIQQHRRLRQPRSNGGSQWSCRHPGLQLAFQGGGLHEHDPRPGPHRDDLYRYHHGRGHPLVGRRQGRRRLRGFLRRQLGQQLTQKPDRGDHSNHSRQWRDYRLQG